MKRRQVLDLLLAGMTIAVVAILLYAMLIDLEPLNALVWMLTIIIILLAMGATRRADREAEPRC